MQLSRDGAQVQRADSGHRDAKLERFGETFAATSRLAPARNRGFPAQMLDEHATEQLDLRGGRTPWLAGFQRLRREALTTDLRCEVLIVGAGITGSLAAEHL